MSATWWFQAADAGGGAGGGFCFEKEGKRRTFGGGGGLGSSAAPSWGSRDSWWSRSGMGLLPATALGWRSSSTPSSSGTFSSARSSSRTSTCPPLQTVGASGNRRGLGGGAGDDRKRELRNSAGVLLATVVVMSIPNVVLHAKQQLGYQSGSPYCWINGTKDADYIYSHSYSQVAYIQAIFVVFVSTVIYARSLYFIWRHDRTVRRSMTMRPSSPLGAGGAKRSFNDYWICRYHRAVIHVLLIDFQAVALTYIRYRVDAGARAYAAATADWGQCLGAKHTYDLLGAPSPDCGPHPDERPPAWLMGLAHLVLYCWGIFLFLLYGTRAKFVDQWTVAFKQATRRTNSFLDGLSPRPTPDQPRMTFFQSNPSAARPAGGDAAKADGVELKDAKNAALTPPHRPSDQVAHAVKVARGLHAVRDVRKPPAPAPQPGSGVV